MNGKTPGQAPVTVTLQQPTENEVAVCRFCGAAYWLETKIIAVKPSMLVGQGQLRMEKPGIIICGHCLKPAILPWLTYGEAKAAQEQQQIAEDPSGEPVKR